MKPEELILTIADNINVLYKVTNEIKILDAVITGNLEPEFEGAHKNTMVMLLVRYSDVSITTQEQLLEYFKIEKELNLPINLTYKRLYNKLID